MQSLPSKSYFGCFPLTLFPDLFVSQFDIIFGPQPQTCGQLSAYVSVWATRVRSFLLSPLRTGPECTKNLWESHFLICFFCASEPRSGYWLFFLVYFCLLILWLSLSLFVFLRPPPRFFLRQLASDSQCSQEKSFTPDSPTYLCFFLKTRSFSVVQVGFELKFLPASAFRVLGLQTIVLCSDILSYLFIN